jgi:hypothetical protein
MDTKSYVQSCRPSISALFKRFSQKPVLSIRDGVLKNEAKNMFENVSEDQIFIDFANSLSILQAYRPHLSIAATQSSTKISRRVVPEFSDMGTGAEIH